MKTSNKYIVLTAMALTFAACTQEEDFSPQTDGDAVKINATIDRLQTRVAYEADGATNFINGDEICVQNTLRETKNIATYTFDGTTWTTTDALVWNGGTAESQFQAWYPATASFDKFTLPTDQISIEELAAADWMTASTSAMVKPDDKTITLAFEHKLAKITVEVTEFTSQFGDDPCLYGATIYSLSDEYVTVNGGIRPVLRGNAATAIVCPGTYTPETNLMAVTISDSDRHQTFLNVPVNAFLTNTGLEAGKHYKFSLKVGKDAISITKVNVEPWTTKDIDGGVAEEVIPNTFDATAMTAEQLNATVAKALDYGHTELAITLAADADATMFSAITIALAAANIAEGSIDLTISGVKAVPEYGFFDYVNYFDNNEKNIAGDKLKSLTLTDVETIGEYAFSACTNLEAVNMPNVVTIGKFAFNEYTKGTKLTSLDLPNATTIGENAFAYSSLLISVNLPKVVTIGLQAFDNCDIRTLDLPEVTTIGGMAFLDNYNLVSCSAPKATTIDSYPWGNCSKLETLELTAAGNFTLYNNLFVYTPTGQINLVLNKDKESQVTQNDDGTATWKAPNIQGGNHVYTFKSITMQE
ncbi:MAG: leucine-rich repeat protein [Paludibacteraceae bacterium]|nr:leucine-rich repeat protein [Paludibacteraceae bacterium]